MRFFNSILIAVSVAACTNPSATSSDSAKIDALQKRVEELKPGFGEIMGVVQQHHAKLHYAGIRGNWELSQYQLDEIKEGLEDVGKHYPIFKEVKLPIRELIPKMMNEPLKAVSVSIHNKDLRAFKAAYTAMTTACNSCHQATEHGFVVIQTPTGSEFTNQKFSP